MTEEVFSQGASARFERFDIMTRKTSQFWEEYRWAGCKTSSDREEQAGVQMLGQQLRLKQASVNKPEIYNSRKVKIGQKSLLCC